jgi:hypothetical protein
LSELAEGVELRVHFDLGEQFLRGVVALGGHPSDGSRFKVGCQVLFVRAEVSTWPDRLKTKAQVSEGGKHCSRVL